MKEYLDVGCWMLDVRYLMDSIQNQTSNIKSTSAFLVRCSLFDRMFRVEMKIKNMSYWFWLLFCLFMVLVSCKKEEINVEKDKELRVVITTLNPPHTIVEYSKALFKDSIDKTYRLDIDSDYVPDFAFRIIEYETPCWRYNDVITPHQEAIFSSLNKNYKFLYGSVRINNPGHPYILFTSKGRSIGYFSDSLNNVSWQVGSVWFADFNACYGRVWGLKDNDYVVPFRKEGEFGYYYGWIRISLNGTYPELEQHIELKIHQYAISKIANATIVVE
ncbi:MAG: hypothetical protein CL840_18375 [Crocinitomicaceae bacterium]|nr:hypothetical protein [Crocinitomicaceae bacterium]